MRTYTKRSIIENKAFRAFWSHHIESWLRSGITRGEYCRAHRISRWKMGKWINVLAAPIPKRLRLRRKPPKIARRRKLVRTPARGSQASFAFWAMHVEALHESGLTAIDYAHAHRLSERRLRKERLKLKRNPVAQNWREMMHPKGRPSGAYRSNLGYELRYDRPSEAVPDRSQTLQPTTPEPITAKRRQWTQKQKLAIVAEATEPGVTVATVAERHGISAPLLFRWRAELGLSSKEPALLMTARAIDTPMRGRRKRPPALVLPNVLRQPPGTIVIELSDGRRVFAPEGADPDEVRRHIAQREAAP